MIRLHHELIHFLCFHVLQLLTVQQMKPVVPGFKRRVTKNECYHSICCAIEQ